MTVIFELKIFVFVFCCLVILKNIFEIAKVMYMKEGRVNSSTLNTVGVGLSVSYVITVLITGFQ